MAEKTLTVSEAIDVVRRAAGFSSDNRLAGALDVSRQALHTWRSTGKVPALRACQMEALSNGAVTWRDLCPEVLEDLKEVLR